jgi:hypothetical protein
MRARATPLVVTVTPKDLALLRAINTCRYMTARQVARLEFSPGSLSYVRGRLARLSGDADAPGALLFSFCEPTGSQGNRQRIFCLTRRGRELLVSEGTRVDFCLRPYKALGFGYLRHCLRLSDVYVAGKSWSRRHQDVVLRQCRLSYHLSRIPDLTVIPDLYMLVEKAGKTYPLWIEIDNSTEYAKKWSQYVRERLTFIKSDQYKKIFHTPAVLIAYLVIGLTPLAATARRQTLCRLTMAVLQELNMERWAPLFRFGSAGLREELCERPLFTDVMWYRPEQPSQPVSLFPS